MDSSAKTSAAVVYGLAWSEFPSSLRLDLENYLQCRADPDALLKWSFPHLRESSRVRYALYVREFAAALVHQGVPISTLDSLRVLATPCHLKLAVKYLLARSNRERSSFAANMVSAICCVARHWTRISEADLNTMIRLRGLVEPKRQNTRRAIDRMNPIADQRKIRALLRLPAQMMREARGERDAKDAVTAAILAQTALAIELLLLCPMRPWSLRNVRIDRHIQKKEVSGITRYYLEAPGLPSQRACARRYELSSPTVEILLEYLSRHHGSLTAKPSPHLFVAWRRSAPRSYSGFHLAISEAIRMRLGLKMAPSDLRFLAGALHLRQHPRRIELVSRLLGHSSTRQTKKLYDDVLMAPLMARYQRMVV